MGSERALNGFGTTDMAGDVKEWCLNESRDGKRLILGGGFGEPSYMFSFADAQSPWERRANCGFRCVNLDSPLTTAAAAHMEAKTRDYWTEKPVAPSTALKSVILQRAFIANTTVYGGRDSDKSC